MLILTGIHLQSDKVKVYDTDDGSNEVTNLSVLAYKMREKNMRIYGLRLFNEREFYPPDAQNIPVLGLVVIPSEAKEALDKARSSITRC